MPASAASPTASRGIALTLLATLCFALMDSMSKHLVAAYPLVQILWVRYLCFATFAFLVAGGPRRALAQLRVRSPALQIFRSALLLIEIGVFIYSLKFLGLADAHVLMASTPLIVTALSVLMLGENVGARRWTAIIVGFAGVAIVLQPNGDLFHPAAAIPLTSAFLFALYQIITRKVSGDGAVASLTYLAVVGLVALTILLPWSWQVPTAIDLGIMIALGFLGAVGHFLFIKALEAAPASVLQPFFYAVLVWAIPLGYVIFGQVPAILTLVGASVIVSSGLYTFHRERVRGIRR